MIKILLFTDGSDGFSWGSWQGKLFPPGGTGASKSVREGRTGRGFGEPLKVTRVQRVSFEDVEIIVQA